MPMCGAANHTTTNIKRSGCAFWRHCGAQSAQGAYARFAAIVTKGLCLGLLAVSFTPHQVAAAENAAQLSSPSRSLSAHKDVLWVDYDGAVSLHRVITTKPKERRLQRLGSPTPFDHRISYGCINVPAKFYNNVVSPAFTGTYGIVYVLPETRSISEIFAFYYDVE
jgi:hypothetical protein